MSSSRAIKRYTRASIALSHSSKKKRKKKVKNDDEDDEDRKDSKEREYITVKTVSRHRLH